MCLFHFNYVDWRMKRVTFALCALLSGSVFAGEAATPAAPVGDAKAGQTKAAACGACHGPDGNSPSDAFPKLAGQHVSYAVEQLKALKDGKRKDPMMTGQAAPLSDQDMLDIATFYSAQTPQPGMAAKESVEVGQKLYRGGDIAKKIPACMACHAPNGAGNVAAKYPRLSGQHAAYTAKQFARYKEGNHNGSVGAKMMQDIANRLSSEEIKALSEYIAGLY
jgi:cytochrome c553